MKEIWKDIKGYEKFYQVSNFGRVKSLQRKHYCPKKDEIIIIEKEKIIKAYMVKGYMSVVLTSNNKSKTFLVHRLVAKTFITNIENKPEVNHKDGNKLNNCVENLEWCTKSENIQHAFDTGLKKAFKGDKNSCSKAICQYTLKNVFIKRYGSTMEAEREKQANHSAIIRCCKGNQKTAGGFLWRYE